MVRHLKNGFAGARLAQLSLFIAVFFIVNLDTAAANVFEVRNIQVDVRADTAADARQQALAQAERRAFYALIERLALRKDQDRIPNFSAEEIAPYVLDFSVAQERASDVRYIATLNYRFKSTEMRDLLRAYGVPFAETQSKPLVILPVYEIGASTVLWDEPNPWRAAWSGRTAPEGLVPLLLPLGDLSDIASISASDAMAGDPVKLTTIAARYGAIATVVAHANLAIDAASGRQQVTVTLLRPEAPYPPDLATQGYLQRPGETVETLMTRAMTEAIYRIESAWKEQNLLWSESTGILPITVPITGIQDWLAVKQQLSAIGLVRKADIVLLSKEQVRVNLHYAGTADQLSTALEQGNLSLLQEAGEWVVMPIGVFQPPRT